MDERVIQFRVGVLVMATLIITVILIVLFGDIPTGLKDSRTIYVRFESAPGVTVNTPVRKSGILVGRITQVDLQDDGSVLVTAKIDADRPLRQNEVCRIGTGNVLGDAMMEFVPDPLSNLPPEPLADGAYLEGVVAQDFMSSAGNFMNMLSDFATDLRGTLDSIESAGQEISRVATNLNNVVVNNQDGFNRILVRTESALGRFDTVMTSVNQIVTDEEISDQLRLALEAFPKLVDDAGEVMEGIKGVTDGIQRVANEAEQNLRFLKGLTEPLGEQGTDIVTSLGSSANRLDSVLKELEVFAKVLNTGEGSLGQFVHNPELYNRLNSAAANIEEISYRLEPILDDVRVISDKLARNPGRLATGALFQKSGLK